MKTITKLFAILSLLILLGCSNENDKNTSNPPNESTISIENSETNTFQVLEVHVDNVDLKDNYNATLGDLDVVLTKIDDNSLGLFMPNIVDGIYNLEFELGNLDITIVQTELDESKEAVIDEFKTMISDNFIPNSIGEESQGLKILNDISLNATEEEKQAIALFFEANRSTFEDILSINNSLSQKNIASKQLKSASSEDFKTKTVSLVRNVAKITIGVTAVAIGKEIVIGGIATGGLVSIGGGIISTAGMALIIDTFPKLKTSFFDVASIAFKGFDIALENDCNSCKKKNNQLSFTNGDKKVSALILSSSSIEENDRESDNSTVNSFFKVFDNFKTIIEKVNNVIDTINEIPFINISKISSIQIPNSPTINKSLVDNTLFSNYSFKTLDSSISVKTNLLENGKVEITLTADESLDLSEPIETQLVINYTDDFNDLTKEFDIVLESDISVVGKTLILSVVSFCINGTDDDEFENFDENYNDPITFNEDGTMTFSDEQPDNIITNSYEQSGNNLILTLSQRKFFSEFGSFDSNSCDGKTSFIQVFSANLIFDSSTNSFKGSISDIRPETSGLNSEGTSCSFSSNECSGTGEMILE